MFVHMSPEMDAVGETLSTLKFAERVATIELGAAKLNKENGEVKELKEQVLFQSPYCISRTCFSFSHEPITYLDPLFNSSVISTFYLSIDSRFVHASFQIANLKAALARKEGESEPLIRSSMSSPEIFSMESGIPSPDGDVLGSLTNDREPMEDVGNLEVILPLEH